MSNFAWPLRLPLRDGLLLSSCAANILLNFSVSANASATTGLFGYLVRHLFRSVFLSLYPRGGHVQCQATLARAVPINRGILRLMLGGIFDEEAGILELTQAVGSTLGCTGSEQQPKKRLPPPFASLPSLWS